MKTDDVLQALEQCVNGGNTCMGCPLIGCFGCRHAVLVYALETIKRQRAESERLEAGRRADSEAILSLNHELLQIRTKTIKEFAERMKGVIPEIDDTYIERIVEDYIDNLVKEMTEVHDEP